MTLLSDHIMMELLVLLTVTVNQEHVIKECVQCVTMMLPQDLEHFVIVVTVPLIQIVPLIPV